MPKKTNWDRIRSQKVTDTVKYRDVYEDQQLERGELAQKQSMLSRNILNGFVSTFVFLLLWILMSVGEMILGPDPGRETSGDPSAEWIHVNEHYVNINDSEDKLTPQEYQSLLLNYDPTLPEIDEPVKPEDPKSAKYEYVDGQWGYTLGDGTFCTPDEYDSRKKQYEKDLELYEQRVIEYRAYCQKRVDPSETYTWQKEHYRNMYDTNEYILPEEYATRVQAYENQRSQGKLGEDIGSVPNQPVNPAVLYQPYEYGYVESIDIGLLDPENSESTGATEQERVPIVYANRLDATKITYYQYDDMVARYEQEIEVYETLYLAHREKYHPDNVANAKVFSMGFTMNKFLVSLMGAGIVFVLLYSVLSKNLKAQNQLADTSDINQYHNDQHVALPEEIQRKYDWFPDVGAHSAVQVSSMISHMALVNKGLKRVQLASRADKDIVDSEGNVEYFKGDILRDEDGNPITSTVPIIDEAFMDALFDASGAPPDKSIRKLYDATKIPYNPDGSDRDKLGKFNTVADLINEDWEFPLYEPQRPGGAYIVDTAPVNTMVLAITRAGKGQTVIEPTLDMWMREKRPNNMVVNDPKGELLVKNYVRATVRGLQVVQFNLINAMK